ncbi:MAG: FxsA family protein [Cohaesibacteraceae bacterium]|nr:FxsA family protein [Cohaesibacteraceae bacterium]MBL4875943.1 FxsA family protein [Cohaesibacteraceae bacterium]
MPIFWIIPILFIGVPVIEIGLLIEIGGRIGALYTIALIIFTALLGSWLLRQQGFSLLKKIQKDMSENKLPGRELVHGVMIIVAGVLLLTPGFATDAIGFLLFIPVVRDFLWTFGVSNFLQKRARFTASNGSKEFQRSFGTSNSSINTPDRKTEKPVIDLDEADYVDVSSLNKNAESPWNDKN